MKKIESLFEKIDAVLSYTAWALRITILILCFVWVVPVWKPYVAISRAERLATVKNPQRCLGDREIQAQKDYFKLRDELVANAKAQGIHYGPEQYFKDLKRFNEKARYGECAVINFSGVTEFQQYLNRNIDKGYYKMEDLEKYRAPYETWAFAEDHKRSGPSPFRSMNVAETMWWLVWFMVSVYWKGLALALVLYLARMGEGAERYTKQHEGTLSIFLDDKIKFFIAVILWPKYLFVYPYNVKRRVLVTAELRRLGLKFRRLTKAERKLISRLTNADDKAFQDWRTAFRKDHEKDFRRSFARALFVTLLIILLTPSSTMGNSRQAKLFVCPHARAGPTISICIGQADQQVGSMNLACLPEPIDLIPTKTVFQTVRVEGDKLIKGPARSIDHVPVPSGCAKLAA